MRTQSPTRRDLRRSYGPCSTVTNSAAVLLASERGHKSANARLARGLAPDKPERLAIAGLEPEAHARPVEGSGVANACWWAVALAALGERAVVRERRTPGFAARATPCTIAARASRERRFTRICSSSSAPQSTHEVGEGWLAFARAHARARERHQPAFVNQLARTEARVRRDQTHLVIGHVRGAPLAKSPALSAAASPGVRKL